MEERLEAFYRDRKVLVTGGVGFVGSNLVRELVRLGAAITVIDACFPDQGANLFNLKGVLEEINLVVADIGAVDETSSFLVDQEVVFNLAACISHVGSLHNPLQDLERNCASQLRFLCALGELSPQARVVYTGSRSQYGSPLYLPVDEEHPLRPVDINGVHKTAVEEYHRVFHEQRRLRYTSLRLSNVFGPRHQMLHDGQGFLNWFIRQGLCGEEIRVFGTGGQRRDFLYVDDAVEAILLAAACPDCEGKAFNLASGTSLSVAEAAAAVCELTGTAWRCIPFPLERLCVEPGDVILEASRLKETLCWRPRWDFHEALKETVAFYSRHGSHYFHDPRGRVVLDRKGLALS